MLHTQDHSRVIPSGTQVITLDKKRYTTTKGVFFKKRGAVGVVLQAPGDNTHPYLVRFPDGHEVTYMRSELAVRKREIEETLNEYRCSSERLLQFKVYECLVGSRAYGLADENSDEDLRGVYLPPARLHWSLFGVPHQLEDKENDRVYWEFERFLRLALKANPNILEVLFTPNTLYVDPLAEELLEHRHIFISKHIYKTYGGYVLSQFKRMDQDLRNRGEIRFKHACHCLRLLIAGCHALNTGEILVHVGEYRDLLLQIKHGKLPFPDIQQIVQDWERRFNQAVDQTTIPDHPDFKKANEILLHARIAMLEK